MGATSVSGRRARRRAAQTRTRGTSERRAIAPGEAAWIAVVPCALLTLAAIVLLAPPLGRVFFPQRPYAFWPNFANVVHPEPTEHAAFLLALAGVLALSAAVAASAWRAPALGPAASRLLARGGEAVVCGFLVIALVAQHGVVYDRRYTFGPSIHTVYFTWTSVAVALLLAAALVLALRSDLLRARLAGLLRETRARRRGALAVAALFAAAWLLTAVNVDASVGNVNRAVLDMLPWSMDETYAILEGHTPLVDFHPQYGQLWPYVVAATMAVAGTGIGVYTTAMAAITGLAMLAVYGILRRVARSSLAALALFLPFLATSFFVEHGPLANRYGPSDLYTIFPVRYAGPYLLAWLLARRLGGDRPRGLPLLFLAAGFVVLNNPEFGGAALGATVAACVWTRPPRTLRAVAELAGSVVGGLLGAGAVVTLVALARSGSTPDFGAMFEFAKLYGVSGWAMLPMPVLGFHLVVFATVAGALTLATVRAVARERDVLLTGMLAWSGVFGLGVGAYYAGRSHPEVLIDVFSAWALALALLAVVAVRALAARPSRRPRAAELAVLVGMGLAACSIAQTPTPWSQLDRLANDTPEPAFRDNAMTRFIDRRTHPGEPVAILNPGGHRMAYDLGLENVSPYASSESIATPHQLAVTVEALRAAGGRRLFVWLARTGQEMTDALLAAGFVVGAQDARSQTAELIDRSGR
jgi:hypothetical protein